MPERRTDLPPLSPTLYHMVALGMTAYSHSAFRVRRAAAPDGWRLAPGEILLATHRSEADVPIICTVFYTAGAVWRTSLKLHFAAREDMFERGFFAGFPPDLSPRARRLLFPIAAGRWLPRVLVFPLPYPGVEVLRLGRALEAVEADTPLAELLSGEVASELELRAAEVGLPTPTLAGDVRRGEYADLLWRSYDRDTLSSAALETAWRRRTELATEQLRSVIELVRHGAPLLFFPEGQPRLDGQIGPLRGGLRLLVRRGRPKTLRPLAIAYDPLTCGREYAEVAVGRRLPPPGDGVDTAVLAALRSTMPLTAGQVVARELRSRARSGERRMAVAELDGAVALEVERGLGEARPVASCLLDRDGRRARLADALRRAVRDGLADRESSSIVRLRTDAVLDDSRLARMEREHASAREG